jgi:hypothetical protein
MHGIITEWYDERFYKIIPITSTQTIYTTHFCRDKKIDLNPSI